MTERENFCRNIAAVSYGRYNGRKGDRKACGRTLVDPTSTIPRAPWINLSDVIRLFYYSQVLKNGVVLCQLMNKISPDSVKKFKTSGPAFLLMENISAFQVTTLNDY